LEIHYWQLAIFLLTSCEIWNEKKIKYGKWLERTKNTAQIITLKDILLGKIKLDPVVGCLASLIIWKLKKNCLTLLAKFLAKKWNSFRKVSIYSECTGTVDFFKCMEQFIFRDRLLTRIIKSIICFIKFIKEIIFRYFYHSKCYTCYMFWPLIFASMSTNENFI
jgi:hypothetical protein